MTSKQNMDDKNHNPAGSNQHTQKTGASSSQRQQEQSGGPSRQQGGTHEQHVKAGQQSHKNS